MGSRMKAQLICDALRMAIWQREHETGLVHRSDRGSQYASKSFRRLLKTNEFKGSMSRKSDCWKSLATKCFGHNAVAENFFDSLK